MKINRFQAFGVHLLGSILIGLCCATLVFLVWYPWPFPVATGVTKIFLTLLSVDVVVGPCITLIVFNTAKKELKRDLAIVLFLQISALLYGMHAVFVARPVYVVFNVDRFDLVFANDFTAEKLNNVSDAGFKSLPLWGPEVIAARLPDEAKAREKIMFAALDGGDDLPQLPQYYVPYTELKTEVQARIQALERLKRFNKDRAEDVATLIGNYTAVTGGVGFLPLRGKVRDLTVIINKNSAEVLEIKNLKPWP